MLSDMVYKAAKIESYSASSRSPPVPFPRHSLLSISNRQDIDIHPVYTALDVGANFTHSKISFASCELPPNQSPLLYFVCMLACLLIAAVTRAARSPFGPGSRCAACG